MENRGQPRITIPGLDGAFRIPRTRYRCTRYGQKFYAADGRSIIRETG